MPVIGGGEEQVYQLQEDQGVGSWHPPPWKLPSTAKALSAEPWTRAPMADVAGPLPSTSAAHPSPARSSQYHDPPPTPMAPPPAARGRSADAAGGRARGRDRSSRSESDTEDRRDAPDNPSHFVEYEDGARVLSKRHRFITGTLVMCCSCSELPEMRHAPASCEYWLRPRTQCVRASVVGARVAVRSGHAPVGL